MNAMYGLAKRKLDQNSPSGHHIRAFTYAHAHTNIHILTSPNLYIHTYTNTYMQDSDFNSLRGAKIFYGSMVALEFITEHMWLTIDHSDAEAARQQRSSAR